MLEGINKDLRGEFDWVATQLKEIQRVLAESYANAKTTYHNQFERHHITAQKAPNAKYARDILIELDIGINSDANTIMLKKGFTEGCIQTYIMVSQIP